MGEEIIYNVYKGNHHPALTFNYHTTNTLAPADSEMEVVSPLPPQESMEVVPPLPPSPDSENNSEPRRRVRTRRRVRRRRGNTYPNPQIGVVKEKVIERNLL